MTYDERIYELVKKKNKIELAEEAREVVDKAIEIATEIKADLDEEAKVIINEAIRVATDINAELDDIWEDYNTMKTKYDYVMGLVAHLEELAKKYKSKAMFYYERARATGMVCLVDEEFE